MDEKYRIENPLGFQVTSYRVDRDYDDGGFIAAPPPDTESPGQTPAPVPAATQAQSGDLSDPSTWAGNALPSEATVSPPPTQNNANGTGKQ